VVAEAAVPTLDGYQRAAVEHGEGPAIVLAGPGSGKTRVIVERAVRLIEEAAARPDELLVLTFRARLRPTCGSASPNACVVATRAFR
jgi:superfamily I DNA and RNA helicase